MVMWGEYSIKWGCSYNFTNGFWLFLGLTPGIQADTIFGMNQPFAFGFYFYFSKPLRPQLAEEVDLL
jgi:hypothetical protein